MKTLLQAVLYLLQARLDSIKNVKTEIDNIEEMIRKLEEEL